MLCSSAARLAQSKGLHRQPSRQWKLPAAEVLHRNWTFWAVYCLEKYIALRSGRPSVSTIFIGLFSPHGPRFRTHQR
jgi:hypothetical protein